MTAQGIDLVIGLNMDDTRPISGQNPLREFWSFVNEQASLFVLQVELLERPYRIAIAAIIDLMPRLADPRDLSVNSVLHGT